MKSEKKREKKPPKAKVRKGTLKQVLRYVGKYPFSLSLTLVLAIVTVGFTLYVPILVGDAIDCIVDKGQVDFSALKVIFFKIGASVAVTAVAQWLMSVFNNKITFEVVKDIRADAFAKISRLPLKYLDSHSHGDTVSRIIADADQFADGLLMGFTQFFTGIMTILGTLAFMLALSWQIALVVVFVTPLSLFIAKYISSHTYTFFKKQSETRGEQTAFTEEIISNLKTVQAFSHEKANEEKFDEINKRLEKYSLDASFYSSLPNPTTRFVNNIVYALVALIGALYIVSGRGFSVGNLTTFLSYANQYTKPFNEISGVVTELQNALACAARIFELLDEAEQPSDAGNRVLGRAEGNVSLESACFSYVPGQKLIEDFSLKVKPGEKVAIVGPTGCGKTTLINLLMRFYDVTGGAVKVEGEDVREITRRSLRSNYGMVLQETWLKSGTVRDNIKMGRPSATDEEMYAAAKASHADGFIRRLSEGYDTVLSEEGGSLSQGQKQLLCIARIMLCLPPMLILDEATSSIDTRTEMKISDAFNKLTEGRTSFVVAHRLSTIRTADTILVMNAGQIVEQGTHGELLEKRGFYYKLYNSQFS
ncbi:MAG: ABC transporter ATP-binding protein [Clostridia bacterium]|nr:ABC transporter ATP-binding protein [Clostridia bacterium]